MIIQFIRKDGKHRSIDMPFNNGVVTSAQLGEFVPLVFADKDYSFDQWIMRNYRLFDRSRFRDVRKPKLLTEYHELKGKIAIDP